MPKEKEKKGGARGSRYEDESAAAKGGKPHEPLGGASGKTDSKDPMGAARKGGQHSHSGGEPRK